MREKRGLGTPRRWGAKGSVVGLIAVCAAAVVYPIASVAASPGAARAASSSSCRTWNLSVIATHLGILENLEPNGRGGMVISNQTADSLELVTAAGKVTTLVPNVPSPGGIRFHGGYMYFNTNNSLEAGAFDETNGTIGRMNLKSGRVTTWAGGLSMPNGLDFLPNGDAVVTRDVPGARWGVTEIPAAHPARIVRDWVTTQDSNGVAVAPSGRWLYFDQTFESSDIDRVSITAPHDVQVVGSLGLGLVLDDLTIGSNGVLYIASNRPDPFGEVIEFNPYTKQQCAIATGLGDPAAVKFGCGPGWSSGSLYVSAWNGDIYKLTPPKGEPAIHGTCDATTGERSAPPKQPKRRKATTRGD
jgi:hypothetical protein